MPREDAHVSQADKNERFNRAISAANSELAEFTDWAITGLFYAALHYIDAVLDHMLDEHPTSHRDRNHLIAHSLELSPIHKNYLELSNRSMDARYRLIPFSLSQVERLRTDEFEPLKQTVRTLLSLR